MAIPKVETSLPEVPENTVVETDAYDHMLYSGIRDVWKAA